MRKLPKINIDPTEEDIMQGVKYLVTIEETQAWLIFNEVAKYEAANSLCLPLVMTMSVKKQKDGEVSMLSEYVGGDHVSAETKAAFEEANIIDFKYIVEENHMGELVVPFNVPRISASVLVSEALKVDRFLKVRAFTLAFKVDGKVVKRIKPVNLEQEDREINGQSFN